MKATQVKSDVRLSTGLKTVDNNNSRRTSTDPLTLHNQTFLPQKRPLFLKESE